VKTGILAALAVLFAPVFCAGAGGDGVEAFKKDAAALFESRNRLTAPAQAVINADKCLNISRKVLDLEPSCENLYSYARAIDFRFYYLDSSREESKKAYREGMAMAEAFCASNTCCASSPHAIYALMTFTGRYSELIDLMEAATSGYAGKIRQLAETLYAEAPEFNSRAAAYTLGRLHYKAPNIIFILTWPDKKLSKKYLEEFLEKNPDSVSGRMFLADTLWELGEKDRAAALYREAANTKPRPSEYFEDVKAIEECRARMKELGIQ